MQRGHEVVAWDPEDSAREQAGTAGITPVDDVSHVPGRLDAPRA